MAWLPVVFIGACKYWDKYNRYLEVFHGFASCQPTLLQSTYNWINPFKQSFFTVGVGQTEGICSVVILFSYIVIIIRSWDRDQIGIKLATKYVVPKVSKFYIEKGYLC